MSCYLRHLKPFLAEADITLEASNKKQVDETVRQIIDASGASCPETWKSSNLYWPLPKTGRSFWPS